MHIAKCDDKASETFMSGSKVHVLHRNWHLRDDDRRVLLYQADADGEVRRIIRLDPSVAVVLTFFDGRTIEEVCARVGELFCQTTQQSEVLVSEILKRYHYAFELESPARPLRTFDPRRFVIPARQVDVRREKLYRPLSLVLHVSDWCMRSCRYCNVEKRRLPHEELLPLSCWNALAEEASAIGVHSVQMLGGDPFMRSDFTRIIESFHTRGIQAAIATKAHITKRLAATLAGLGVRRIQYSLDSADASIADFLTRSPGFFHQAVQSIENLVGAGVEVYVNAVVTNRNVRGVCDLTALLNRLGVSEIFLAQCALSAYSPELAALLLSSEELKWLTEYVRTLSASGIRVNLSATEDPFLLTPEERTEAWKKRTCCRAGTTGFTIHSDGIATACAACPTVAACTVGDLKGQSLMEVWNSPRWDALLRPPRQAFVNQPCFECEEFEECHRGRGRCFADSYAAAGEIFAPPPACPRSATPMRMH